MQIVLNVVASFLAIIALAVIISYAIRSRELRIRQGAAVPGGCAGSPLERVFGIGGEVAAVFCCLVLYPLGYLLRESSRATPEPGELPLILCHGYWHNRSAFVLLRYRLRKAGRANVIVPNFRPASAMVPYFAERLSEKVREAMARTGCEKVDLVGHSMGGLVVRYFIEHLGGASCARMAVTIGTPNRGTKMAALGLFRTAEQFRTDSPLIQSLNAGARSWCSVTMASIWSEFDSVVLPAESAQLPEPTHNLMVRNVGHVALLFSGQVFRHLVSALSIEPTP
ncbi:MAG: hypothetical protein C4532_11870 [Candidatus Abyssobacteria bacterium SURF_17]|uniref:AB hydrolase-1 domain-containing protein n=1 Tax=Candidatus Abyssobacteria bacterium SURF_17 TaxID=2093361 RepID=A0A419EW90_9BACT|nr:MAG: hypothetical protein C4532_11870 [Candidatus Abyssubacteria bacterium SURF_17]